MEMKNIGDLANLRLACACGRTHVVPIQKLLTGKDALMGLPEVLEPFRGTNVFLIGDTHTLPLARGPVVKMLEAADCRVTEHTFSRAKNLILDEALIGSMLVRLPQETGLIVTIGSGTLNDLSRVVATRCRIPWVIIGTAPSMDGYASTVSAVVMDGGKHSVPLGVPYAILTDPALLATAPDEMISSGVGDILGKYVALCDWQLARRETGEYYCDTIADMIHDAADRCAANIERVKTRNLDAIQEMADTLVLSGLAISMHGLSRPASGCEHQLAHYWEVACLDGAGEHPLHGNFVGLGTQVACRLYELAAQEFDLDFPYFPPKAQTIRAQMDSLGTYATLQALGVTEQIFYDSFFHATEANGRYTLVMFLTEKGRLTHYAKALTKEFFGGSPA